MKIFMVHEDPWHAGNPYISTLIEEIKRQHPECELEWGRERFWSESIYSFDIVHFHWPQTFMANDSHSETDLLQHIETMKRSGVTVVSTCHDLEPHYKQYANKAESMRIVYSKCNAIFHLGEFSKLLFEKKYPDTTHLLLPHHVYDTIYRHFPSREESLRKLHLPLNRIYILCFGTFRDDAERNLVISLYKQMGNNAVSILAPGFIDVKITSPRFFSQLAKKIYYKHKYHILCTGKTWGAVKDSELPYYYGAADIAFIQRRKILNSGNVVLPMLFGKVVVGPDCGNVGPLLKKWGYPVFSVDNINNISDIVSKGIEMEKDNYGPKKREEQIQQYRTAVIAEKLYSSYEELRRIAKSYNKSE